MENKYAEDLKRVGQATREIKMGLDRIDQQEISLTINKFFRKLNNQCKITFESLNKEWRMKK